MSLFLKIKKSLTHNYRKTISKKIRDFTDPKSSRSRRGAEPIDDFSKFIPYLCDWYYASSGKRLHIDRPKTLNEKIQWLKIYDSTPEKSRLADKYAVKPHIAARLGDGPIRTAQPFGIWKSFDAIDFATLPRRFMLKATHGCRWNIVVQDQNHLDMEQARRSFAAWLDTDYAFCHGFEMHYSRIEPRILAEEFIGDDPRPDLYCVPFLYYKFYCLNGVPHFVRIGRIDEQERSFYAFADSEYRPLPGLFKKNAPMPLPPRSPNFAAMERAARELARDFSFVRVDFIESGGLVYFNEMTFTPTSGLLPWLSERQDRDYGALLTLPTD